MTNATEPSTMTVCPSWCTDKPGHDFDPLTLDPTREARTHSLDIGTVDALLELHEYYPRRPDDVYVAVGADENRDIADGGDTAVVGPFVTLDSPYVHLTAAQAREVAGLLLLAAGRVEELA